MLPIKLFRLVFCLFRFNRNIETLCFGTEAKQPKQTVSKQTEKNRKKREKNRKNHKFSVKNFKICSLSNCFGLSFVCFGSIETSKLFVSVYEAKQPKQMLCFGQCRNKFRFQFRLFRIETSFEGHPNHRSCFSSGACQVGSVGSFTTQNFGTYCKRHWRKC